MISTLQHVWLEIFLANVQFIFFCRPKKVKPEISPEVLKSMEEKLAAMVLEHTPNIVEATA